MKKSSGMVSSATESGSRRCETDPPPSAGESKAGPLPFTGALNAGPLLSAGALNAAEIHVLSRRLAAMSHPVRLQILNMIHARGGEICVCEFEGVFKLSQPAISHHLKLLRDAGLIRSNRKGRWVHHRIVPEVFRHMQRLLGDFSDVGVAGP